LISPIEVNLLPLSFYLRALKRLFQPALLQYYPFTLLLIVVFPFNQADLAIGYLNACDIAVVKTAAAAVKIARVGSAEVGCHISFGLPVHDLFA
jgi:hypothetical protein